MTRLALFFLLPVNLAWAADVNPKLCRDIDPTTRPIVPAALQPWYKFQHAVQACPAYSKKHQFLWWIITINLKFEPPEAHKDSVFYPLDPGGFTRHCTPYPYIIDRDGRVLGRIADAFPTGGFGHTDLYFSNWVNEFPQRITVKVFDAGVEGNYTAPPLVWNPTTRYYDKVGATVCDRP